MKIKLFSIFLDRTFSFFRIAQAQDKKEKKKSKTQPKLTVVEIQEPPPVVPIPEPQKPPNGSLFTDGAANGNLVQRFQSAADRRSGFCGCRRNQHGDR